MLKYLEARQPSLIGNSAASDSARTITKGKTKVYKIDFISL